jgi:hypothetical protein
MMKRYTASTINGALNFSESPDGWWVRFSDHEAEMQRLRDSIGNERLLSRLMGLEDGASAYGSLVRDLHALIEEHWTNQCSRHACGCGEWPECTHTLIAAEMRRRAMALEEGTG